MEWMTRGTKWLRGMKQEIILRTQSMKFVSRGTNIIILLAVLSVVISGMAPVAYAVPLPNVPTVAIDSISPNPTNSGTVVEWHADSNGEYEVRIGAINCTDGTVVESGSYSNQPTIIATAIPFENLLEGANSVTVCVTDILGDVGLVSDTMVLDTVLPIVVIDLVTPRAADGSIDVTWRASKAGTYSVQVGGTTCADSTEVSTAAYTSEPNPIVTTIDSIYLVKGVNIVRVCVTDAAGNVGIAEAIAVEDTTAPVITLDGDNPMTTPINRPFYDPGAFVTDDVDTDWFIFGDETSLNVFQTGLYSVTYDATDLAGNSADQVSRSVLVDDMDSVDMDTESAAPNSGDANNDGLQDQNQPRVASLLSPVNGKYAVLDVTGGYDIQEVSMASEESNGVLDPGYDYPAGMMHFTLVCGTPEEEEREQEQYCPSEATITQLYYGVTGTFVARKYNTNTHIYETIDGATITEDVIDGQAVTILTYTIADGGSLDMDGEENGVIVDPVGLASVTPQPQPVTPTTVIPATITAVKAPNTGSAPQSSGNTALAALSVSSLAVLLWGFARRRTNDRK